jgi:hypothetical protein
VDESAFSADAEIPSGGSDSARDSREEENGAWIDHEVVLGLISDVILKMIRKVKGVAGGCDVRIAGRKDNTIGDGVTTALVRCTGMIPAASGAKIVLKTVLENDKGLIFVEHGPWDAELLETAYSEGVAKEMRWEWRLNERRAPQAKVNLVLCMMSKYDVVSFE